jgi:Arylsulfatase A and related enzymes
MNNDDLKIINSTRGIRISEIVLSSLFFLLAYVLRAPILTFLLAINGLIIAIKILINVLKKSEIELLSVISYGISIIGAPLYFVLFGVKGEPLMRFTNLILAFPSILLLTAFLLNARIGVFLNRRIIAAVTAFLMVGTTLFYSLATSFRSNPSVKSLQEGHDAYLASVSSARNNASSPNVLIILMDDLGYSDISKYGYLSEDYNLIQTPNIDSIGENGVVFENFYSACAVCSPSRFGVLTGRYPARGYVDSVFFPTESLDGFNLFRMYNSLMFDNGVEGMLGDEITIAEALSANGYTTGAFGKWHLGDYGQYLPTSQGFDTFYGSYYSNDMSPYSFYSNDEIDIPEKELDQRKITSILETEVTNFIETSAASGEKFFAYYASPWPHYPVSSGEAYAGTSDAGTYGDCIEEFDASVGNIIETLKASGVYDDTLIIFTSDNGPWQEGGSGGSRGRKNTCYEGGQKVPFMACYKNGFAAQTDVITAPAIGVDIFPTVLSYCGVSLPTDRIIDGINLKALFDGTADRDAALHDCLYYINGGDVKAVQARVTANGVTADYKFADKMGTDNAAYFYQTHKNVLINLETDPLEAYNQTSTYPDIAAELQRKIEEMQKSLKENRRGKL